MRLGRALLWVSVLPFLVVLAGCSGDGPSSDGNAIAGKRLFEEKGCGGCHTFAAAGSIGKRGPDLDDVRPSSGRVVGQLRRGGGLMPSFAGKLSDREMRDLAAFVGGGRESDKSVARPFKPNSVKLDDCRGSKPGCFAQAFGNMTYRRGPKPALTRLTAALATNRAVASSCHRIAHRMGSAALARFDDRVAPAFIAGSAVCASGYYHGIVERAFLGQPTRKLAGISRRLCADPRLGTTRFLAFQCNHGLGHGLMIYTGYDLPLSLETCDDLAGGFKQSSCAGGVFMENFNSSYGVKSKYLRAKDPIYPCNAVAERHKYECYLLVTAHLLNVTNHNLRKTAAGCRRSEREHLGICFQSFGRDVSAIAGRDARKARRVCRLAGSYEADCLYGIAREIVNADADAHRAGRFCARVARKARGRCFSGIGTVLAALVRGPTRLRRACGEVSGRWTSHCRRGAGLAESPSER